MTATSEAPPARPARAVGRAWDRFWFAPRSTAPLLFVRVVLGLVTAVWGATFLPDAWAFLGPGGVLPDVPDLNGRIGLLHLVRGDLAATVVVAALVPAGLAVAVGWRTRGSTIVAYLCLLSISRRDPWMLNSGDALLRHAMLFLTMTPAGQVVSVDRWHRHRDRFWEVPHAAPWGLRLLQIQLSFVYLFSSYEKLTGAPWLEGTALADAWRLADLARFPVPLFLHDSLLVTGVLTYTTLVIEVALAVALWNRRLFPWVAGAGVALHIGIEYTMAVGFFSTVAVSLYLAFVPPDTAERWIGRLRGRFAPSSTSAGTSAGPAPVDEDAEARGTPVVR